jgi:hypothetical protein
MSQGELLPLLNNMPTIIHPEDLPYQMNPEHPGHIIRFLFAGEVFLNIIEAVFLVFFPDRVLNLFLAEGFPVSTPLLTLMQFFGMLWVGITVVTALGVPNTPTAIETRKSVYRMYAVLDLIAVVWLHYLAFKGPSYSGFSPKVMSILGNLLILALIQRLIPLVWFPAAFGRYEYILDQRRSD